MNVSLERNLYLVIAGISAILLGLSAVVHLTTFWHINIYEVFPWILVLHILFFPLLISFLGIEKYKEKLANDELITINPQSANRSDQRLELGALEFIKPDWRMALYCTLGLYVMANFFIFVLGAEGSPEIVKGEYVLTNRTKIIRTITREEYDVASAQELRGISGHWLIFYFYLSLAACSSYKSRKSLSPTATHI